MFILIAKYFMQKGTEYSYLFCTKLDAGAVLLRRQPLGCGTPPQQLPQTALGIAAVFI